MPWISVKRGKPTMYQTGEREFVCKGLGYETTGSSMAAAFTNWKQRVALSEMSSMEVDKMRDNVYKGPTGGVLL